MNNPQMPMGVPILHKNNNHNNLTHYLVTVLEDGKEVTYDWLISGYGINPIGGLNLVMNDQLIASYTPGTWRSVRRADTVPEVIK